ncbi:unnamed protein product [Vitrella brassicaformis CCMP3155]|uniref:Protein kinase domain-containing protein n=1 Tax=Vitrella brassicaformis (strain CCMP3155) TaxID=1169540 RepID=A0A0G4GR77_VITBC|nr:unnamed protein product [Vitrella brassicaformis CCMP3155]|eukprot:CEM32848.1 unnamed protein product [Vitrella brassicaformis CCMP3155]
MASRRARFMGAQAEIWKLSGGKAAKVLGEKYSRGGRLFRPTYRLYAEKGLASCPNIVRLLESFDVASAGRTCILMEFIEGQGVWELGGCVGEGEAKTITRDLLRALAYLHRRHLAHHDVKPENLMRRADDSTVLIDLDLMKEDLSGEGAAEDMMWAGVALLRVMGVDADKAEDIAVTQRTEAGVRAALANELPEPPSRDLLSLIVSIFSGASAEEALKHPWLAPSAPLAHTLFCPHRHTDH